jgi:ligand-binding SRPBCC domain-containing protein
MEEAWQFFSDPRNLRDITPDYMDFQITSSDLPDKMYPGLIVHYKVRPVMGLPITWVTEITHVDEPGFFVDEQRFGPYRMWHHQHLFREIPGGVEMDDIVEYVLPFGPLGTLLHALFIRKQLNSIFDYRFRVLAEKYGTMMDAGRDAQRVMMAKVGA